MVHSRQLMYSFTIQEIIPMIIKLKSYLASLEEEERTKPSQDRRRIPTITDLAKHIGISRIQMQRIASGNISSLKLDVADRIITEMRKQGFPMDVGDLIGYRPEG